MPTPPPIDFGSTPWGRDWVKRVEPITITAPNPMLPRARSLVRGDRTSVEISVGAIDVSVTAGKTRATVSITAPTYTGAQRRKVLRCLAESGSESTASGDLPDSLHTRLGERSLEPLPDSLSMRCSCASKVDPCLHVVAAAYAVGVYMDRTPVAALTFRGVSDLAEVRTTTPPTERWVRVAELDASTYYG